VFLYPAMPSSFDTLQIPVDSYCGAYEALVCANPVGHGMDFIHVYTTIAKVDHRFATGVAHAVFLPPR
jgi:hypothetical protein